MKEFETYFNSIDNYFIDKAHEYICTCYVCGQQKEDTYRFKYDRLYECNHCGFTWLAKQPTQTVLDAFYKASKPMQIWADLKASGKDDARQNDKFSFFWHYIKENKVTSVLDVGCGNGYFLSGIPSGVNILGIDPNEDARRCSSVPVVSHLDGSDHKFDMITAFGVLEHVKDPRRFTNEYLRFLNPGGFFGVIVPNINSLSFKLLKQSCCTICSQHLSYFSVNSLVRCLSDCNLQLYSYTTKESEYSPICKKLFDIDPYEDLQGLKLEHPTLKEHQIIAHDMGAKICAIFKYEGESKCQNISA